MRPFLLTVFAWLTSLSLFKFPRRSFFSGSGDTASLDTWIQLWDCRQVDELSLEEKRSLRTDSQVYDLVIQIIFLHFTVQRMLGIQDDE